MDREKLRMVRVPADAARLLADVASVLVWHLRDMGHALPDDQERRIYAAVFDVTAALGRTRQ